MDNKLKIGHFITHEEHQRLLDEHERAEQLLAEVASLLAEIRGYREILRIWLNNRWLFWINPRLEQLVRQALANREGF